MKRENIIVVGLGNKVLGDDGIGVHLANDLEMKIGSDEITFMTSENGGLEMIDLLKDHHKAFIIDGIRTPDGNPGDIYFMDSKDFMETLHISSSHDVDFRTALKLAGKIDLKMPDKISIIAVEVLEEKVFSEVLTEPLRVKYNDILQLTMNSICSECFGCRSMNG